jgi:hypothetical protein
VTSSLQGAGPGNETALNLQSWPFTEKCGSGATSGMVGSPQRMEMSSKSQRDLAPLLLLKNSKSSHYTVRLRV